MAKHRNDPQRKGEAKSDREMAKLNKARCDFKLHLAKEREIIQWLTTFSANA